MVKNTKPLEINCYSVGFGAFGIFFRWMQTMISRTDAGVYDFSVWLILLPLLFVAASAVYITIINKLKKNCQYVPDSFYKALRNEDKYYKFFRFFFAAVMVAGGVLLFMECNTDRNPIFLEVLAVLGGLSGIVFPFILDSANRPRNPHPTLVCFAMFVPILLFGVWLVTCYKQNSNSAVYWDYLLELCTASAAMLGFFRIAGFIFNSPSGYKAIFFCMLGTTFCISSLADSRYIGQQLLFAGAAMQLTLYNWIMISNLRTGTPIDTPSVNGLDLEYLQK